MSNSETTPLAPDEGSEAIRRYLVETARRELDNLRTQLDTRLAALESALAHPERHASLETLVIDLARVATAEAEAAARRAALEAQAHAQERAASGWSDAQRALESERVAANALRTELDRSHTALQHERDATSGIRQELDAARSAVEAERVAAAARDRELGSALTALQERAAAGEFSGDRDQVKRDLDIERTRSTTLEAELARLRNAAVIRETLLAALEREDPIADLDAARQAASVAQAALEAHVKAHDTERTLMEHALTDAEKRAAEAVRARDGVIAELEELRKATIERIKTLEAQIAGEGDDLSSRL